jgi:preprotein translocase subunit SecG
VPWAHRSLTWSNRRRPAREVDGPAHTPAPAEVFLGRGEGSGKKEVGRGVTNLAQDASYFLFLLFFISLFYLYLLLSYSHSIHNLNSNWLIDFTKGSSAQIKVLA